MSTIQLRPYVNFQGRAREALAFYQRVLGGTLDLRTTDEQGAARPAGPEDRITLARLDADGACLLATDGHPSYPAATGDHMAITLSGTEHERLTTIFSALAAGGKVKMPLMEQPGGAVVGWLTDQFGINWMVMIERA